MSYELPKKLRELTPYEPLTGACPIRLDANESFLSPPEDLRRQIARAVAQVDFNRYPDPCCSRLCGLFADFFGLDPQRVVAGNGSDELIGLIVSSFTQPGEAMVVTSPEFSMYAFYAQMCGVEVHSFGKDPQTLDLDVPGLIAFAKARRAKLLILSNPCNPTSRLISGEEALDVVRALEDCLVVVDEAYMDFADGSVLSAAHRFPNLIVLKTCSKAFGMAAIRLGFAVAGETLARALRAVKSPYNVNAMTQAVGCVLLAPENRGYLLGCIEEIKASREALYQGIRGLDKKEILQVANTRANFVFLKASHPEKTYEALKERGIAIRCMPPYLRVTAGSRAENAALLTALNELLT